MANLVLAFAELVGGAVVLDAAIKGDTITNVVQGKATQHPLTSTSTTATTGSGPASVGAGTEATPADVAGAQTGTLDKAVSLALGAAAEEGKLHNWTYTQASPGRTNELRDPIGTQQFSADCSGFIDDIYKWAGLPSPFGTTYTGAGFVSSLNPNVQWKKVTEATAVPGDIAFFPDHVALYIGGGMVVNMGAQGEPYVTSLENEITGHNGVFDGLYHLVGAA